MTASALEREPMAITISGELQRDIARKAAEMSVSVDQAVCALLKIGLEEQARREAEYTKLIEQYRANPADETLGQKVGEALFGS